MRETVNDQTTICQHHEPGRLVNITRRALDRAVPNVPQAAVYTVKMDCGHGGQRVMVK